MSVRWSDLSPAEREVLEERFHVAANVESALAEADAGRDRAQDEQSVSLSLLQRYATLGDMELSSMQWESVSRNPRLGEALDRFLSRASVAYFPRLVAASSGEEYERRGEGFSLRLLPTKAREDQLYLIITMDEEPDRAFDTLTVRPRNGAPVRLSLPAARDRRIQILLPRESEIVRELRNDAQIYLQ